MVQRSSTVPVLQSSSGGMAGPRRVVLISNFRSGHNRDRYNRVQQLVSRSSNIEHFATSSPDEVPGILAGLADNPPEFLAINGGDGTAAHIFGLLLEQQPLPRLPTIVLLPGGTANMTAGDVGCRGSLVPAVKRLCRWSDGENLGSRWLQRHVMRLQPSPGAAPRFGMFLGSGVIIQATEYAHSQIHSRGLRDDFSLGLGLVRTLWGIARGDPQFNLPLALDIAVDGGAFQHVDVRIVAASTLDRLFLGARPFWGVGAGALKASFITSDARHFVRRFPGLLWGRPGNHANVATGYHSVKAERIQLLMDGSVNLDGEMIPLRRSDGPAELTAAGPLTFCRL